MASATENPGTSNKTEIQNAHLKNLSILEDIKEKTRE